MVPSVNTKQMDYSSVVPLPSELQNKKLVVEAYVKAKIHQFAVGLLKELKLQLSKDQLDSLVVKTLINIAQQEHSFSHNQSLRLNLAHDCQSTGCADSECKLCQLNPSRYCQRHFKSKYLIDDHLVAKCGALLRVDLVNDMGELVQDGLPPGVELEMQMLNGEMYWELTRDGAPPTLEQLKACIIGHHPKALLRRDGQPDDMLKYKLIMHHGQAVISDFRVTTSSEVLLQGKAPTLQLLVWAVDSTGEPVPNVPYVVSETFVVATKRVRGDIKSDIPYESEPVRKLQHIGKATADKLLDIAAAAADDKIDMEIPAELNCIQTVGQFQKLVDFTEANLDLKAKIPRLLKLSPEKWKEAAQHAQSAVVPDHRPRVWWCTSFNVGLVFQCKNNAIAFDPIALVKPATQTEWERVVPLNQHFAAGMTRSVQMLTQQAHQAWGKEGHPGWEFFTHKFASDAAFFTALGAPLQMAPSGTAVAAPAASPQQKPVDRAPTIALPLSPGAGNSQLRAAVDSPERATVLNAEMLPQTASTAGSYTLPNLNLNRTFLQPSRSMNLDAAVHLQCAGTETSPSPFIQVASNEHPFPPSSRGSNTDPQLAAEIFNAQASNTTSPFMNALLATDAAAAVDALRHGGGSSASSRGSMPQPDGAGLAGYAEHAVRPGLTFSPSVVLPEAATTQASSSPQTLPPASPHAGFAVDADSPVQQKKRLLSQLSSGHYRLLPVGSAEQAARLDNSLDQDKALQQHLLQQHQQHPWQAQPQCMFPTLTSHIQIPALQHHVIADSPFIAANMQHAAQNLGRPQALHQQQAAAQHLQFAPAQLLPQYTYGAVTTGPFDAMQNPDPPLFTHADPPNCPSLEMLPRPDDMDLQESAHNLSLMISSWGITDFAQGLHNAAANAAGATAQFAPSAANGI